MCLRLSQGSRSESVESISSANAPPGSTTGSHSKTPSNMSRNLFKLNSGGISGGGTTGNMQQHSRNSSMGSASDVVGVTGAQQKSLVDSTPPSDNQSTNTSVASVDAAYYSKYYANGSYPLFYEQLCPGLFNLNKKKISLKTS